ncbi:MAG: peptidase E, partial [Actinomycetota bacterium]
IVAMGGGGFSDDDTGLDRFVTDLTGAANPRVCFVPTASGDAASYVTHFEVACASRGWVPSLLTLFERRVADIGAFLGEQDVIYVGGGNTANMLAIWRHHGVDTALRAAWDGGVVLCGVSAGANCWFEASSTDSYGIGRADALGDGLGFLPGSFCPHYHGEPERRPGLHRLIASGELPDAIACDDFAAVHFSGTQLVEAVASDPRAGAYRVTQAGGGAVETHLPVRAL